MAERVRSIEITIVVDTNKETRRVTLMLGVDFDLDTAHERVQEYLVDLIGERE